ncbi:hypothetical protein, partial [Phocaeicola sartorii]
CSRKSLSTYSNFSLYAPKGLKVISPKLWANRTSSETLYKLHGCIVGTRVILPDKQVEALNKHDIYFPKGNILHIIFIVDIFGKAIFGKFITGICLLRGCFPTFSAYCSLCWGKYL